MAESFPHQFGPYVLIRMLGAGGMGDVYFAVTGKTGMDRPCVVKRLAQYATSEDRERFRREANLARMLSHGAIVQTLAVDEVDGELVIAQEFLHGCSLSNLLATCLRQREQVPARLAVHIAREVARALAYAHEQGVVHRDIAPDNIMLTFAGEVRLLDFGIARAASDSRLTRPGWSVGREVYAAPEIVAGGPGDPRSDIFSLGILLWQLLSRRPPPVKESLAAPSRVNGEVTPELDAIVSRAVSRDPSARFQRVEEILRALGSQLPPEFAGEAEVAAFLQKHFDVAHEKDLVSQDLARGRAFLEARAAAGTATAGSSRDGGERRLGLWAGGVAAAVLLGVVSILGLRTRHSGRGAEGQAAAPAAGDRSSSPPPAPIEEAIRTTTPPHASAPALPDVPPQANLSHRRIHASTSRRARDGFIESESPSQSADLLAEAQRCFDLGDMEGALRNARAAIRTGGGAPAHLLAGRALGKKDQLQDAEHELAIAVRLDPTNAFAAQRLREVRERIRTTTASPE
jgi:hypothetical protein